MSRSLLLNIVVGTAWALEQHALQHMSLHGEDTSILQVQETLQNLLKSIEDEGRSAESLFQARQSWCSGSLKAQSLAKQNMAESLEQLKSDLNEHEAAVDEASGTIRQIQADIALTEHIINKTKEELQSRRAEEDADAEAAQHAEKELVARHGTFDGKSFLQGEAHKLNASLVVKRAKQKQRFLKDQAALLAILDNKKQSLSSMQGELEAEYPLLAQLQELTGQTHQQIADRDESLQSSSNFASVAQDACQKATRSADAQAAARTGAANSIEAALQHLEKASGAVKKDQKVNAPTNFIQVDMGRSRITASDVFSLVPQNQAHRSINLDISEIQENGQPDDGKSKITSLLNALKSEHNSDQEHKQWCVQERARNELQLRLKQDTMARFDAEISAHNDAEAQLDDDVVQIDAHVAFLEKAAKDAAAMGKKEIAFAKEADKDHRLATRILDQAVAILLNFEAQDGATRFSAVARKSAGNAARTLKEAGATFAAQKAAASAALQELQGGSQRVSESAEEAISSQKRERTNIELAKDKHGQKRSEAMQNRREIEAEVKEAQTFIQQLKGECGSKLYVEEASRRAEQIQALEDAQQSLDGKALPVDADPDGTDDIDDSTADGSQVQKKELTPMERAAMEMGVSTN